MERISLRIEAGDIVRVDLNPTVGHEKRKERFCLVVEKGSSHLDLIIVLPITNDTGKRSNKLYVQIDDLKQAGLNKPSVVDCYQIRSVSIERLVKSKSGSFAYGKVSEDVMFEVRKRLALLLDIGEEHTAL